MSAAEIAIFANPIAGAGRSKRTAQELHKRLTSLGYRSTLIFDRVDEFDVRTLPRQLHAAVVIGGDGTLRAVARKLTDNPDVPVPPLLVVPMGTANLMGRYLGLHKGDPDLVNKMVAAIVRHEITQLDAARANGVPFLLVAGAGLDGEIIHELEKRRSGPIDLINYVIPASLALLNYAYPEMTIDVDGNRVLDNEPAVMMVGNIPEYGTGFPMLPHARPDDGLLDILIARIHNRAEALKIFLHAVGGEHLKTEGTIYLRGKHLRATSAQPIAVQADGEAAGFTPLDVDLLPITVPFIVP
jgi:diacylglycerol kinase (ATP)